jgi:hypothetical protein
MDLANLYYAKKNRRLFSVKFFLTDCLQRQKKGYFLAQNMNKGPRPLL